MVDASRAVTLVIGLFVGALLAAFLLPIVMGQLGGTEVATYTLDVGNETELQPGITATLDSVDGTAETATFTVAANEGSESITVDNGSSGTATVDGADVTITVTEVSASSATAGFETPTAYGWGPAGALWVVIPTILVLSLFLYFVRVALDVL